MRDDRHTSELKLGPFELEARALADLEIAASEEHPTLGKVQHPRDNRGAPGGPLALLTRTAPATATSAHISIIGHITQTELARHTTTVELTNGFLNRFLICACRRVRLLPEGGDPEPLNGTGLQQYLAATLKHTDTRRQIRLADDARELWWHAYPQLSHR